jgi:hypothetical protein
MDFPAPIVATTESPPPFGRRLLVHETETGWWVGEYRPDGRDRLYQPWAWELYGLTTEKGWNVTHWLPIPPTP